MFEEVLKRIGRAVPGSRGLMIMGIDGIPLEQWVAAPDVNLDLVATEFTTLLKSSRRNSRDTGLGELQQVAVLSERGLLLMGEITPDYFMLFLMDPLGSMGRARFELRKARAILEPELSV
ncbi:MAG: roadblock/LC7 domain-containing protein [Acidobacteriota bacterium]